MSYLWNNQIIVKSHGYIANGALLGHPPFFARAKRWTKVTFGRAKTCFSHTFVHPFTQQAKVRPGFTFVSAKSVLDTRQKKGGVLVFCRQQYLKWENPTTVFFVDQKFCFVVLRSACRRVNTQSPCPRQRYRMNPFPDYALWGISTIWVPRSIWN